MNTRRNGEVLLGILFLVIGLSSAFNTPGIAVILLFLGVLLLALRISSRSSAQPRQRQSSTPSRPVVERRRPIETTRNTVARPSPVFVEPPPDNGVYKHALSAARAAGLMTDDTSYVLPIDIGVMAYESNNKRMIQRVLPLTELTEFVQPFIQLRLAANAQGRVKFEIIDAQGDRLFVHEDRYQLHEGVNFISPPSRLRVWDVKNSVTWKLRVYADNTLIAEHGLAWEVGTTGVVRRNMLEDGEISPTIRAQVSAMLTENRLTDMSLDELLASQDDDHHNARQSRGA